MIALTDERYRSAFKGSAMKRAKLRGLRRNAAVVLGNVGTSDDAELLNAAAHDDDPVVAEHARWALSRIDDRARSKRPTD
jgi:epoxyqueuosine reductase